MTLGSLDVVPAFPILPHVGQPLHAHVVLSHTNTRVAPIALGNWIPYAESMQNIDITAGLE